MNKKLVLYFIPTFIIFGLLIILPSIYSLMNILSNIEKFPLFIQKIYSSHDPASYRSFRITLNPDEKRPIPPETLQMMVDEMFDRSYLSAQYNGSSVAEKFTEFSRSCR